MQVSFFLRKDKKNKRGEYPIRMSITFEGNTLFKQVKGIKTLEKHWKDREQRIKPNLKSEDYNNYIEYNKKIDELESKVKSIFRYILLNNIQPSKDFFEEKLKESQKADINLTHEFFPCFEEFIQSHKNIRAKSTLKRYRTTFNFLKDFENDTNYKLYFDSINNDFLIAFRNYSFEKRKTLNNYYGRLLGYIKTFMNWAYDKNYHKNNEFRKFKKVENEIEVIYLTIEELLQLLNHDFKIKRLNHVRDIYCFGAFTGLRYSDIKQLKETNIHEDKIVINIQKTKSMNHIVPLNKFSKQILEKYKDTVFEPLPVISGQKFNQYIKECCKIIGLDTPTQITRFIGSQKIEKIIPKYELITAHTARKSFITNSLYLNMNERIVREITGHKKEENFRKYINIAEERKQSEMNKAWDKI